MNNTSQRRNIAILTQPLQNNYGGLLQNYALQKFLKGLGHEVCTINLTYTNSYLRTVKGIFIRLILKYILRKNILTIFQTNPSKAEATIISQNTKKFVLENVHTTEIVSSIKEIYKDKRYCFDTYIVGSDQVWRPRYSPNILAFFLSFLGNSKDIKRISYAASFGVDKWEFSPFLTGKCKRLARKFDAISVREDSGVTLCKEYLGVTATHLIDPTLLLEKEDYVALIEKDQISGKPNSLLVYVLDHTPEKMAIVEMIKNHMGLEINSVMPEKTYNKESRKNIDDCVFPPVTQWLRGFMDAEFVVTDSFHGTIFSILFNKPFVVIGNERRGLTRLSSLLKKFILENRLIFKASDLQLGKNISNIDFDLVNQIIEDEKRKVVEFFKAAGLI